jgi:phosphoribosylaminoimidazolecarboxamide formyltransferase / IMP cyclohydrolase
MADSLELRYGVNPHQKSARAYVENGTLPFKVLNGSPGYINVLDALNSWQLVTELKSVLALPAAASFKHVSPAGAAVATPLTDELKRAYFVEGLDLSPLATAYARARGADRVSSYLDWVALSDKVDVSTAKLVAREFSDGVVAPNFDAEALDILSKKRGGKFCVLQMDPSFTPEALETRDVFGVSLSQTRNDIVVGRSDIQDAFDNPVPDDAVRDLLVGLTTVKYTQSNAICLAADGQIIGVGAGQQSRIHCTRLASSKADTWYLRQHPAVLGLNFRKGLRRPERDNAVDGFLRDDLSPQEEKVWAEAFEQSPQRLSAEEKRSWIGGLSGVAMASDGLIPFRDNVDRAAMSGVSYLAQPGGSLGDDQIADACDQYGIAMAMTGVRSFHH